MKDIVKKIRACELNRNTDEKYAGGFWDMAQHIVELAYDNENNPQEAIYNALWELYEEMDKRT